MRNAYFLLVILLLLLINACSPKTDNELSTLTENPTSTPEEKRPAEVKQVYLYPAGDIAGIHIHDLQSDEELAFAQDAKVKWTRFDKMNWDHIEPANVNPEEYDWRSVDELGLINAADAGLETIAIVLFTPGWAQKYIGYTCGPIAEAAFDDFAEFMQALVSRYSKPPYNVRYWEIGNEPDIDRALVPGNSGYGCWGEPDDPYYGGGYYAEMLKAVYPEIKAADPNAQVLIGGLLLDCDPINPPESPPGSGSLKDCTPSRFLEGILNAGGGDFFDGIDFHAYDYYLGELGAFGNGNWHSMWDTTGPILERKSQYIQSLLSSYGYGDKELINSEVALLCGSSGNEPICLSEEFQKTKAYYMVQANASALANELAGNVWYSLTGWRGSGLVSRGYEPYLAYEALTFYQEILWEATSDGVLQGVSEIRGYKYNRPGGVVWLLWSVNQSGTNIQLPSSPDSIYEIYGNQLPLPGADLAYTIDVAPIYIVWDN